MRMMITASAVSSRSRRATPKKRPPAKTAKRQLSPKSLPKIPSPAGRRRQEMLDFWNAGGGHRLRRLHALLVAEESDATIEASFASEGPESIALGKNLLKKHGKLPTRKVGRKF